MPAGVSSDERMSSSVRAAEQWCSIDLAFLRRCGPAPVLQRSTPYEGCLETSSPPVVVFRNETLPQREGKPDLKMPRVWGDSRHGFRMTLGLAQAVSTRVRPGEVVIELGTYVGFGTYHLAYNAQDRVHIVTVDSGSTRATGTDANKRYPEYELGRAFKHAPDWLRRRITQVVSKTSDFDPLPFRGRVSLVWVDAGHSVDGCVVDSMLAISLVEPGGYVLWDDVSSSWPGVVICLRKLQSLMANASSVDVARLLPKWRTMATATDEMSVRLRDRWWPVERARIQGDGKTFGGYFVAEPRRGSAWYRRPCVAGPVV